MKKKKRIFKLATEQYAERSIFIFPPPYLYLIKPDAEVISFRGDYPCRKRQSASISNQLKQVPLILYRERSLRHSTLNRIIRQTTLHKRSGSTNASSESCRNCFLALHK